jgi:LPXTG-motif cell wall-anchored protein
MRTLLAHLSGNTGTLIVILGAVLIGFGIYYLVKRSWLWGIVLIAVGVLIGGLHILEVL